MDDRLGDARLDALRSDPRLVAGLQVTHAPGRESQVQVAGQPDDGTGDPGLLVANGDGAAVGHDESCHAVQVAGLAQDVRAGHGDLLARQCRAVGQ
jgi:hypothetical protein